jgi:DNA-binding response OmpR family regulator
MRILTIEDHDGIRIALEILLELEGHAVLSVDRGEEAVKILDRADGEPAFDLILLDLTTNGMSADHFMSALRERESKGWSRPPVCILSASSHLEAEAKRLRSEYFIRKPFDPADLLDTLSKLHTLRGTASERVHDQAQVI